LPPAALDIVNGSQPAATAAPVAAKAK